MTLIVLSLLAVIFLFAALLNRTSGAARITSRTTASQAKNQSQGGSRWKMPELGDYKWITLACGIILCLIGVSWLAQPPASAVSPATGYPKFPSSPGDVWWAVIAISGGTTIALLLRKKGTQPHLVGAAILGIFTVWMIGLAVIQSSASKKTVAPPQGTRTPAPQQSLYLYPGQTWIVQPGTREAERFIKAYRSVDLEKQAYITLASAPFGQKAYQMSWKRIGDPCALEHLVERKGGPYGLETETKVFHTGPYEWEDERDHPKITGVSGRRFRPVGCDEVTIAVKIWRPEP